MTLKKSLITLIALVSLTSSSAFAQQPDLPISQAELENMAKIACLYEYMLCKNDAGEDEVLLAKCKRIDCSGDKVYTAASSKDGNKR